MDEKDLELQKLRRKITELQEELVDVKEQRDELYKSLCKAIREM